MSRHPEVRLARNFNLIGRSDLGGAPNAGEGIAVKIARDGRRIMYLAHENPPMCFSVLDVSPGPRGIGIHQPAPPVRRTRCGSGVQHGGPSEAGSFRRESSSR